MKARPKTGNKHGIKSAPAHRAGQIAENDLLIVAIGASAGGIEAFTELISSLPADTGMAFVLIQHLDPHHHSLLTELISKKTLMSVKEVIDGMTVESNHVYVIPPNSTMSISNRTLHLGPREESPVARVPIDYFMRALAEGQGNRAIGVILSGTGTDGTLGVAEIQAHGGVPISSLKGGPGHESLCRLQQPQMWICLGPSYRRKIERSPPVYLE